MDTFEYRLDGIFTYRKRSRKVPRATKTLKPHKLGLPFETLILQLYICILYVRHLRQEIYLLKVSPELNERLKILANSN